jgi:hypothetical protein
VRGLGAWGSTRKWLASLRDALCSRTGLGGIALAPHDHRFISKIPTASKRVGLALLVLAFVPKESRGIAAESPHAALDAKHRAFLKDYCIECHNEKKQKGMLRLDDITFTLDSVENADRWQKILNQINSGEMPPEDAKQPERVAKTEFLDSLSHTLMAARRSLGDAGGKITMRRLNRREYKNTIRDLLGVDMNVRELPADGGAGMFDTVGSSLFMSSDQFEQYLALGRQALAEHLARFAPRAVSGARRMHVEAEEKNTKISQSLARRTDANTRYVKWTASVDAAAKRPENEDEAAKIRAEKNGTDAHFYSQWQRLKSAPSPSEFGFVDDVTARHQGLSDWEHYVPHHKAYLEHAATKAGAFLTVEDVEVNPYQAFRIPGDWPAGEYVVRVRIAATDNTPASRHFVEFGSQHDSGVRAVMSSHQVTGTMEQPQVLEIPLKFSPSKGRGFFFQEKGTYESEKTARWLFNEGLKRNGVGPEFALWIDWIEVENAGANPVTKADALTPQKLRKDPEQWANKYMPIYAQGYVEKYGRFQKWCAAIDEAAIQPTNADIVKKLRDDPKVKQSPHLFYNSFTEIAGAPAPIVFGFRDVDDAQFARSEYAYHHQYYADYAKLPQRDTGAWLMLYSLGRYTGITAPDKWPAGKYTLRVRLAVSDESPKERRFIEIGTGKADAADFSVLSSHQVTGTLANPQTLEIPVEINASGDRNFAIRDKRPNTRAAEYAMFREAWDKTGTGPRPCIWVDYVELEGPMPAPAPFPSFAGNAIAKTLHIEPEIGANKAVRERIAYLDEWLTDTEKMAASILKILEKPENAEIRARTYANRRVFSGDGELLSAGELVRSVRAADDFSVLKGRPKQGDPDFYPLRFRMHPERYVDSYQYTVDYLKIPEHKTGVCLTTLWGPSTVEIKADDNSAPGAYTLRLRVAALDGAPENRCFIEVGNPGPNGGKDLPRDFKLLTTHQVTGTIANPQIIEVPVILSATNPKDAAVSLREFAVREKQPNYAGEAAMGAFRAYKAKHGAGPKPAVWVDWIELTGPMNAATPPPTVKKTIKERREVELHANAMVGGTYNGYFKAGYEAAKKFMETGIPQKGIPDEAEAKFRIRGFEQQGPTFERYLNDPLTKTGAYLTIYNVHKEEVITLPPDQPSGWLRTKHEVEKAEPGEYMLRFRIGAVKGTPKERHFVELGTRSDKDDFGLMQTFQINATTDAPQTIEVPVTISAGSPRTFVLREKRDVKLDHELFLTAQKATGFGPVPALWIDWVEWEGPLMNQVPLAKTIHIEPETRRAEVERAHVRSKYLNEQYAKWKADGGDEAKLKDFGFTDKSHAEFSQVVWNQNNRWFQQYLDRPLSRTGLFLDNTVNETSEYAIDLPADQPPGDYVMRVRIGHVAGMPPERAFLTFVEASPVDKDDRSFLANKQIAATIEKPEVIELPFKVRPGGARKFVLFEKRPLKKEGISLPGRTRQIVDAKMRDPVLWIDWIEYEGPLNKSDTKTAVEPVFFANTTEAGERDHARAIIEKFSKRAFRDKPPTDEYLNKLTALYDTRRAAGDASDIALLTPLSVVLTSPRFLYLSESGSSFSSNDKPDVLLKPRELTSLELATRLAYFLWSAPPDDTLLALAHSGDLKGPEVLAREVDRMVASPKADEFVSGFVHQWLGMERLDFFQFDTKQFRDFDESAKAAARREVYETFAHLLRSNGSARDLLKCDYVLVNGLLATYYGIEGVSGDVFRKVALPKDSPRGGLLGMAAILAMGSNGERTSPVERGAWVLRKLLHDPPPPAPPNIPQITRLNGRPLTTRERLLAHQEEPQCASCHRTIDPIGFGLENFNAAGKWRTEDSFQSLDANGRPAKNGLKTWTIDPGAAFHKGPAFRDYLELRELIAAKPGKFARGLTEALIQYALGRPFGFTDEDLVTDIVHRLEKQNFAMRELIVALVTSRAFQVK